MMSIPCLCRRCCCSQPTYEELKQYLKTDLRMTFTSSQPTYEELKRHHLNLGVRRLGVLSLPMRN